MKHSLKELFDDSEFLTGVWRECITQGLEDLHNGRTQKGQFKIQQADRVAARIKEKQDETGNT